MEDNNNSWDCGQTDIFEYNPPESVVPARLCLTVGPTAARQHGGRKG